VSTGSGWIVDRSSLLRALAEWRATDPGDITKSRVYDRIIDLYDWPLRMGREDPLHPGIFQVRVPGTDVIVVFDLDRERKIVYVASIFDTKDADESR
jgi:hypothetical protein